MGVSKKVVHNAIMSNSLRNTTMISPISIALLLVEMYTSIMSDDNILVSGFKNKREKV